jgi:histidinol-phosphate aminotransferase
VSDVLALVREDLRDFGGYASARRESARGTVWLNANESAWPNPADRDGAAHRYPDPQPAILAERLAALYGVAPPQLLLGRGSDEPIDLLVRTFCRAGRDAIVVTPPVFGMYAVAARVQGARCVDVPMRDGADGFVVDLDEVFAAARAERARLVFLCSPANPTGGVLDPDDVLALARRLDGSAVVVVDEAYVEFSGVASLAPAVATTRNLVVLRTLSKAHALAAARIGVAIAAPELVAVLRAVQAPYPLPTASVALALAGLAAPALAAARANAGAIVRERERVAAGLAATAGVRRVYPSHGNFVLARFSDVAGARRRLAAAGVVVRAMDGHPRLDDALRISIGRPDENDALLAALAAGSRS